tara:strand:- start:66 stop:179 length:114 start_codon:yes stop_codon:yes gene_type:complete
MLFFHADGALHSADGAAFGGRMPLHWCDIELKRYVTR